MLRNEGAIQVWLLIRLYHPNFSGAGIQGHRVLTQLIKRGFEATVLTAADYAASNMKRKVITLDGVKVRYLPVLRQPKPISHTSNKPLKSKLHHLSVLAGYLSLSLHSAWVLWQQGRRGDIVQLYSVNEFSFLITSLARARGMHPVMRMTLIGYDDPISIARQNTKWHSVLKMMAFQQAEAMVGCSTAQVGSARFAGFDSNKVVRIPGGVDLTLYHPVGSTERERICMALGLEKQKRYIIFVGSAIQRKGIDVLVKAFIILAEQVDDVHLLIVGPSDFDVPNRYTSAEQALVNQIKQELANAGCASRVHWTGMVDNVHEYMQVSSVFCFPTRKEGFGHVTAEAMAVGLPVVVTWLEGVTTDLVPTDQVGILVNGHRPEDYATALLQLLRDPVLAKRIGDAARIRALSEYDLVVAAQRYAHLYRKLSNVSES
jgi:glycosyltransferase involved in cell wall biosynthesis